MLLPATLAGSNAKSESHRGPEGLKGGKGYGVGLRKWNKLNSIMGSYSFEMFQCSNVYDYLSLEQTSSEETQIGAMSTLWTAA